MIHGGNCLIEAFEEILLVTFAVALNSFLLSYHEKYLISGPFVCTQIMPGAAFTG